MKRKIATMSTIMVVVVLLVALPQAARRDDLSRSVGPRGDYSAVARQLTGHIYDLYGPQAAHSGALYVGAETCLACHSGPNPVHGYDTSGWRDTFHAFPFKTVEDDTYSMVDGKGIVADSNQNGIDDFKDGMDLNSHPVFAKYAPNAPILGYSDANGYTMTIGPQTFRIFFAWGGNGLYKQRFVVKIPVSDRETGVAAGAYVSPLQYNEKTHAWVAYHPEHWWDGNGSPLITPGVDSTYVAGVARSFDKRCAGCHFTGTDIAQDSKGEWVANAAPVVLLDPNDRNYIDFNGDGIREMTHISCEACHGPGSLHIMGHGDPDLIISPEHDFDAQQANDSCGQCHVRGSSSDGTFGFLWDEVDDHPYVLGDPLDPYFTSKPGLWPDGKTPKQHHQQWHDLEENEHWEGTCFACHDLHVDNKHNLREVIRQEEDGKQLLIAVDNDDNTMCLACHAGDDAFPGITKKMIMDPEANRTKIAPVVEAHSYHPYAPERKMGLSRCSKCHMPKTAKSAINYDIHAHTFEVISSEKTLKYLAQGGMPNSCAVSCHRNVVDIFPNGFDSDIGKWDEDSDVTLAEWLLEYFGPDGKWWDHSVDEDH